MGGAWPAGAKKEQIKEIMAEERRIMILRSREKVRVKRSLMPKMSQAR